MQDIIVVGSGIFGVTAALALRERGYTVTVLDQGAAPYHRASSTDISKAVRLDYGADQGYSRLMVGAREGWLRWNERLGPELYHETGIVMLTQEAMAPGGFAHDSFHLLRQMGYSLERLDSATIQRRFPAFAPGYYDDGYFNPLGGYAESGRVVAALVEQAIRLGVTFKTEQAVIEVLEEKGRVRGVRTAQGDRFPAGHVVIAAGAWTPWLLPALQGSMRTVGQPVFHLQPADPDPLRPPHLVVFSADVSRTGWYGFPLHPRAGVLKIAYHGPGRPVDPTGQWPEVTATQEQALRTFLAAGLPSLARAPLTNSRICLYCDTSDGHLWIDRDPAREGLTVAAGGSGHGFKFAPSLGEWVSATVEGRPDSVPERFRWRAAQEATAWQEATRLLEGGNE